MIELQQKLLSDTLRNKAFFVALKKNIQKGKTVVADLGAGTGFLSFLASQLGAKKCFLYEYADIIHIAKKIAAQNGIKNCEFIQKHSAEVKNPPQVDLVISETLGNFALEENIIETMNDAARFLHPNAAIIPQKISQYAAPITSPRIFQELNIWDSIGYSLNMESAKIAALNNMYVYRLKRDDFGKNSVHLFDHIDLYKKNSSVRKNAVQWTFQNAATIYGFGMWWKAELIPDISISTSPLEPPTHWDQIFLPLEKTLSIIKGDTLEFTIKTDTRLSVGIRVCWNIVQKRRGKKMAVISMDTEKGRY